ncbi:hypothetical protein BRC90_01735 [Halobacteriales archaeon QS_4_69_34]|nr:MAG: hypothetical protein BRC90_01735 [Halobacteriales archaeon QS_4_69_34]
MTVSRPWPSRPALGVIVLAFVLRIAGVMLTVLRINPYSLRDATTFRRTAATIASGFVRGQIVVDPLFRTSINPVDIISLWGLALSPFWLLPGPSDLYARVTIALFGTLAVYNICTIGQYYGPPQAAVLAGLPVAVFPSFVLIHATALREAVILAGITTAVRIGLRLEARTRSQRGKEQIPSTRTLIGTAVVALAGAALLRWDNTLVYVLALVAGGGIYVFHHHRDRIGALTAFGAAIAALSSGLVALAASGPAVGYLSELRGYRTRGEAVYLAGVEAATVPEALAFASVGAVYFLFSPFPWMVDDPAAVVAAFEGLGNLAFALAAPWGVRHIVSSRQPIAGLTALLVGFFAAVAFYGLVEGNVGAAVRHRQMFVWVLYVLGGAGIANRIRIKATPL